VAFSDDFAAGIANLCLRPDALSRAEIHAAVDADRLAGDEGNPAGQGGVCHADVNATLVPVRILICVSVLTATCASPALAGPEEDALQVVETWAAAFRASDVDTIVALYAPDALFLGTGSRTVVSRTEEIRQYFERALLTDRPRGAVLQSRSVMTVSDGAVVITGLDTTTAVCDGKPISSPGRVTFVVARRGAEWKIVHFHRSAVPGRAN
jgi:uncharacterized protein (TIGR02246 family)